LEAQPPSTWPLRALAAPRAQLGLMGVFGESKAKKEARLAEEARVKAEEERKAKEEEEKQRKADEAARKKKEEAERLNAEIKKKNDRKSRMEAMEARLAAGSDDEDEDEEAKRKKAAMNARKSKARPHAAPRRLKLARARPCVPVLLAYTALLSLTVALRAARGRTG
jgi:hypothetical protein